MAPTSPRAPVSGVQAVWARASRFLWYVIGYNWLASAAVLPLALLVIWTLAEARFRYAPISHLAVMAYLFVELTAFTVESNWSRIGIGRFWGLAAPFCVLQALLCMTVAAYDPLGCLLLSALCLGTRECMFQLLYADVSVLGYDAGERFTTALLGGFVYCSVVALLCGTSASLVRTTRNHSYTMSPLMLDIVFGLILPLARGLTRMLLTQSMSVGSLLVGLAGNQPGADLLGGPQGPPVDAFLLSSDVAFALTIFLELLCVFLLLLIPPVPTFCVAVAANALFDVLYVFLMEGLQQRRARLVLGRQAGVEAGAACWSPAFCLTRPNSFVATLLSGSMSSQSPGRGEAERLRPNSASSGGDTMAAPTLGPRKSSRDEGFMNRLIPLLSDGRSCGPRGGMDLATSSSDRQESGDKMSPRVSVLLDEYDACIIENKLGQIGGSTGQAVYLFQDRKMTFLTHLFGNTLAVVLAVVCIPILQLREFHAREWMWRTILIVGLRFLSDVLACWFLELHHTDANGEGNESMWMHRHEMATVHSWMARACTSILPLFAVVAGTW